MKYMIFLYIIGFCTFIISYFKKKLTLYRTILYYIEFIIFVYILFGVPIKKEQIPIIIWQDSVYEKYYDTDSINAFIKEHIKHKYKILTDSIPPLYPHIAITNNRDRCNEYSYMVKMPYKENDGEIYPVKVENNDGKRTLQYNLLFNKDIKGKVYKNNKILYEGVLRGFTDKVDLENKEETIFVQVDGEDMVKENNIMIYSDVVLDTIFIVAELLNPVARIIYDMLSEVNMPIKYILFTDKDKYFEGNNKKIISLNKMENRNGIFIFVNRNEKIEKKARRKYIIDNAYREYLNIKQGRKNKLIRNVNKIKTELIKDADLKQIVKNYASLSLYCIPPQKIIIEDSIDPYLHEIKDKYILEENVKLKILLFLFLLLLMCLPLCTGS